MQPPDEAAPWTEELVTIPVHNQRTVSLSLAIEPEGHGVDLQPGERCEVVLVSRDYRPLELDKLGIEVVIKDDALVMYTDCEVEIWQGGKQIIPPVGLE